MSVQTRRITRKRLDEAQDMVRKLIEEGIQLKDWQGTLLVLKWFFEDALADLEEE